MECRVQFMVQPFTIVQSLAATCQPSRHTAVGLCPAEHTLANYTQADETEAEAAPALRGPWAGNTGLVVSFALVQCSAVTNATCATIRISKEHFNPARRTESSLCSALVCPPPAMAVTLYSHAQAQAEHDE